MVVYYGPVGFIILYDDILPRKYITIYYKIRNYRKNLQKNMSFIHNYSIRKKRVTK